MSLLAFSPNTTIALALTAVQSNVTTLGGVGHYIRVCNGGAGVAWIRFYETGGSPPTMAAATAMMVPPGLVEIFSVASDTTCVACLGDGTGTTLNLTRGDGQ